jgi:magnesium transporter
MASRSRDGAPEGVLAAEASGGPAGAHPPSVTGDQRASGKGHQGPPNGKRGLRLLRRFKKAAPGSAAGIEPHELGVVPAGALSVHITCVDYAPERAEFQEVLDLPAFIAEHRPEWSVVRWINVDGLGDLGVGGVAATERSPGGRRAEVAWVGLEA